MVRAAPPPPQPENELVLFYKGIPLLTRSILTLSIIISLGCHLRLFEYGWFMYNWHSLFYKYRVWTPITTFMIYGVNMGFLFDMIFLYRYSSTLEMSKFSGRQGDYAYFLMLLMGTSLACMKYIGTPILSSSLLLAICTLWSFDNSEQNISFYGLINFKAKYFPIFLITFEFILSAAVPYPSLFGLAFSYAYDFLINQFVIRYGYNLLKTPILVEKLFPNAAPPPTPVGRQSQEPIPGPAPQGGYNWGRGNRLGS